MILAIFTDTSNCMVLVLSKFKCFVFVHVQGHKCLNIEELVGVLLPLMSSSTVFFRSIKNNRVSIASSSFTTAPGEGLTLQATGIDLDFSGNLRFKRKVGWYV